MSSLLRNSFLPFQNKEEFLLKSSVYRPAKEPRDVVCQGQDSAKYERNPPESDGAPINKQRDKYRNQTLDNGESIQEIQ